MFRKRRSERRPSHATPSTRTTERTSVLCSSCPSARVGYAGELFLGDIAADDARRIRAARLNTPPSPVHWSTQSGMQSALTPSNPATSSGRFCRRIQPERPSSANISPGQQTRRHATPAENHPEVRNHGKIGGHFLRNRPEVAGGRPQAMSRQAPRPIRYR